MDISHDAAAIVVEVWVDFVCPFSYMGEHKLRAGIEQAGIPTKIVYRSFQLRPDLPADADRDFVTMMAERRNIPVEKAREMTAGATAQAAEIGLTLRYDRTRATNTHRAHELAHLARSKGLEEALVERLFQAYFTEGLLISDLHTLIEIAGDVGLRQDDTRLALELNTFEPEVEADIAAAKAQGISSVPHFVIDGRLAISGGQPPEVFAQALIGSWASRSTMDR